MNRPSTGRKVLPTVTVSSSHFDKAASTSGHTATYPSCRALALEDMEDLTSSGNMEGNNTNINNDHTPSGERNEGVTVRLGTIRRVSNDGSANDLSVVCSTYADDTAVSNSTSAMKASRVKVWEIVCLTSFNFSYGLICGTMGLFILPAESMRLYPHTASVTLGLSLLIVGMSQLVCPLAGRVSDAHNSSTLFGKRKPYLLLGGLGGVISVIGMWMSSAFYFGVLYYMCLFTGMLSLNVIYSVQCGLVPDLVDVALEGTSSGIVAVHTLVGSGLGFALMIATTTSDYHLVYPLYVIVVSSTVGLAVYTASRLQSRLFSPLPHKSLSGTLPQSPKHSGAETIRSVTAKRVSTSSNHASQTEIEIQTGNEMQTGEVPLSNNSLSGKKLACNLSCKDVLESYTIDVSESFDFFWVFLGRTFYYVGVSVQAFILFFLRDVVGTLDEAKRRRQIGSIALLAQACAASLAYPMGKLSDNAKVGKKLLIYVACVCMSVVYVCFLVSPLFGDSAFAFVLISSSLYGAGNGCFLSVDYGLALETLPDKSKAAQALGIWGVSAFIGSAIGPLAWGALIQFFGGDSSATGFGALLGVSKIRASENATDERQYAYTGYLAMLLGGIIATAAAGLMIKFVKAGGRRRADKSATPTQICTNAGETELVSFRHASTISEREVR